MSDEAVTKSSGNIFADLGFENPEEELFKAKLSRRIRTIIKEKSLSEDEAAGVLELETDQLADIVVGQTEGVSIEQLVRCLDRLDYAVDIIIRPKHERKHEPTSAAAA